jgi:hypothetical protein
MLSAKFKISGGPKCSHDEAGNPVVKASVSFHSFIEAVKDGFVKQAKASQ